MQQTTLVKSANKTNSALQKLSSGLRINKGSDGPADLIISELLRSQISGYQRALRNTQETNNVMSIAEGGLSSVSSMLTKMKGLAVHAMNDGITSNAQVNADQMEMNSLLSSINRVVNTTNYSGNQLLNGAQDISFRTQDPNSIIDVNGVSIANITGTNSGDINISYDGSAQAERAYLEADFGGAVLGQQQEFTITGADGARTFTFDAGTTVEQMAEQINSLAGSTGVNAYAIRDGGDGATALRLVSSEYGSDSFVRVQQQTGNAFAQQGGTAVDYGQDASLTVNGSTVQTNGLTADISGGGVNAKVSFQTGTTADPTIAQTGYDQDTLTNATAAQSAAITNIRGGMNLQLGEGSGGQNRETISIGNYNPAQLGRVAVDGETYSLNDLYGGGSASLANNPSIALKVIDQAIADVASGRANIGAYQANTLDTNANNLMVGIENLTASESDIRDTDMAEAMTTFIMSKLLQDANMMGVQKSNQNRQNVLRLLGSG